ncbi:NAD-dependent protein lipoamidase sirtuin-4 [Mortierella polycephala]|uniref:NAD-dependent protein lipoamidase sirtuin-4 n=1 Tax=Mortierella polycephala TaxID=41804 RepID=A0A9P6U8G5_9FUNG|nr:NAD-dependent protein lipoamidase sirtuin-4 [Mortierella polycephala]
MHLRTSLSRAMTTATTTRRPEAPFAAAVQELAAFLRDGGSKIAVITGAGISTDSGIPDYRGENGTYTLNPEYKPVFYQPFVTSDEARRRYWARSFLGFPPVMTTEPNPSHYALAALQSPLLFEPPTIPASPAVGEHYKPEDEKNRGFISTLITQNVDGLHQKAGAKDTIELHGTLHQIKCMKCGHEQDRSDFQQELAGLNLEWDSVLKSQTITSLYSRMNADGDVELRTPDDQQQQQDHLGQQKKVNALDYRKFVYPTCSCCGSGQYKPSVVFFGENIPVHSKEATNQAILESNGLLVIGTSFSTHSAFRLVKLAKDAGVPIAMVNLGQTRADPLVDYRYDMGCTQLLTAVAQELEISEVPGIIKRK